MVVSDEDNRCLRLVDLSTTPTTSTFAGKCTDSGDMSGHRLTDARLRKPRSLEFDSTNQNLYLVDYYIKKLKVVRLSSDQVETIVTWSEYVEDLQLHDAKTLYFTYDNGVKSKDLNTLAETEILGSAASSDDTLGSFSTTRFHEPRGLSGPQANGIWFIADFYNDR